jgi:hypothetical protein
VQQQRLLAAALALALQRCQQLRGHVDGPARGRQRQGSIEMRALPKRELPSTAPSFTQAAGARQGPAPPRQRLVLLAHARLRDGRAVDHHVVRAGRLDLQQAVAAGEVHLLHANGLSWRRE